MHGMHHGSHSFSDLHGIKRGPDVPYAQSQLRRPDHTSSLILTPTWTDDRPQPCNRYHHEHLMYPHHFRPQPTRQRRIRRRDPTHAFPTVHNVRMVHPHTRRFRPDSSMCRIHHYRTHGRTSLGSIRPTIHPRTPPCPFGRQQHPRRQDVSHGSPLERDSRPLALPPLRRQCDEGNGPTVGVTHDPRERTSQTTQAYGPRGHSRKSHRGSLLPKIDRGHVPTPQRCSDGPLSWRHQHD